MKFLENMVDRIERIPFSPWTILFVAVFIGSLRPLFEAALQVHSNGALGVQSVLHNIIFYFSVPWIFLLWLPRVTGKEWRKVASIAVIGLLTGLVPPLLDLPVYGLHGTQYTYMPRFKPLFIGSITPVFGTAADGFRISFGEAASIWFVIVCTAGYVFISSSSLKRALLSLPLSYITWQFIGTGLFRITRPLTYQVLSARHASPSLMSIYFLIIVFLVYRFLRRGDFPSIIKRGLHPLPFAIAVVVVGRAAGAVNVYHFFYAVMFYLAGVILVVQNAHFDREEDAAGGRVSGVTKEDTEFLFMIAFLAILSLLVFQSCPATALLAYFGVWTLYHYPATRLKKLPIVPYAVEGAGGLAAALAGLSVSADSFQVVNAVNYYTVLVLPAAFAGFMAGSVFKDYKDVEGDRAAGVQTLYVLALERGIPVRRTHILVYILMVAANITPVIVVALMGAPLVQAAAVAISIPVLFYLAMLRTSNKKLSVEITLAVSCSVLIWLAWVCPPLERLGSLLPLF